MYPPPSPPSLLCYGYLKNHHVQYNCWIQHDYASTLMSCTTSHFLSLHPSTTSFTVLLVRTICEWLAFSDSFDSSTIISHNDVDDFPQPICHFIFCCIWVVPVPVPIPVLVPISHFQEVSTALLCPDDLHPVPCIWLFFQPSFCECLNFLLGKYAMLLDSLCYSRLHQLTMLTLCVPQ